MELGQRPLAASLRQAHPVAACLHMPLDLGPCSSSLSHVQICPSFLRAGLVCDEQRVLFNGKQLEDTDLLSLAGVKDEATLNILGRLLGGAKKRKKKTYTKPKKQKHKHKKIKLRVLKFYKVGKPARICQHAFVSVDAWDTDAHERTRVRTHTHTHTHSHTIAHKHTHTHTHTFSHNCSQTHTHILTQ